MTITYTFCNACIIITIPSTAQKVLDLTSAVKYQLSQLCMS